MEDISAALGSLIYESKSSPAKRGRKPLNGTSMTQKQRHDKLRDPIRKDRKRCIAVLDMETDPFDERTQQPVFPFVCELYSDQFGSIVIWEEDIDRFVIKVVAAIEALPDQYTIYAHNGGKFDFLFLISKIKGEVRFKGRAIMAAKIGNHELRDSLHILPEKLAAWKKDTFDYSKMKREVRYKHKTEILAYLHSDCVYLFDIVKSFIAEFGLKLSIGQAAFSELKKSYKVQHLSESSDEFLRRYFFGGRVECLVGRGLFQTDARHRPYRLYDVNSMYPSVMAHFHHPVGNEYHWRRGDIGPDTCFLDIRCRSNGALVARGASDPLLADVCYDEGRYFTSIWEYNVSLQYDLLEDVEILGVVDFKERTDFSKFIVPLYERRQIGKAAMARLKADALEETTDFEELKKQDLFLKYLLNNAYGKFAQNPRRFREYYYTEAGEAPPQKWMQFLEELSDDDRHRFAFPCERTEDFHVWARPSPGRRYNNVATAASITGAARAVLLEAIQNAVEPVYCDTDSLICRELLNCDIHKSRLGAWDLEATFDRVIIAGKKLYACEVSGYPDHVEKRLKTRSKGALLRSEPVDKHKLDADWTEANARTWRSFETLLDNAIIENLNRAPTISKSGGQHYMKRRIRATAPLRKAPLISARRMISNGS